MKINQIFSMVIIHNVIIKTEREVKLNSYLRRLHTDFNTDKWTE